MEDGIGRGAERLVGGNAGKLSAVPSTLPLSVTGATSDVRGIEPGSAGRRRSRSKVLLTGLGSALASGLAALLPLGVAPVAAAPASPSLATPSPALIVTPLPSPSAPLPPLAEVEFAALLKRGGLETLEPLCLRTVQEGDRQRLKRLRDQLLLLHPAPQPLPVVLANADVLLSCQAPEAALAVLDRYGPAPGAEQVQWLTLQWRAANAALDHRRAALALERLVAERYAQLETLSLPLQRRDDGTVVTRSALEVMASHLESGGQNRTAAQLLLLSRPAGLPGALRLQQAARLLQQELSPQELDALLESALEQAASVGAWGLVNDLLDTQAALPAGVPGAQRARERRLRLSPRLDDAYGEWLLRRGDPAASARREQLERQLRSPLQPGGHAADLPAIAEPQAPVAPALSPLPPAVSSPRQP
jgi:hypothetical protein